MWPPPEDHAEVVLCGNCASLPCRTVWHMARMFDLPVDICGIDFAKNLYSEECLALNPVHSVPFMVSISAHCMHVLLRCGLLNSVCMRVPRIMCHARRWCTKTARKQASTAPRRSQPSWSRSIVTRFTRARARFTASVDYWMR